MPVDFRGSAKVLYSEEAPRHAGGAQRSAVLALWLSAVGMCGAGHSGCVHPLGLMHRLHLLLFWGNVAWLMSLLRFFCAGTGAGLRQSRLPAGKNLIRAAPNVTQERAAPHVYRFHCHSPLNCKASFPAIRQAMAAQVDRALLHPHHDGSLVTSAPGHGRYNFWCSIGCIPTTKGD